MKRAFLLAVVLLLCTASMHGQAQPPFIFMLNGGLFFPSNLNFRDTYQSNSDLVWGFGVNLPVAGPLLVTADMSYFHADGFPSGGNDSIAALHERFIHAGLLEKQPLADRLIIRVQAGLNYVWLRQETASAQTPQAALEINRKVGYYGGVGVEQLTGDPHFSFFMDVLYDYCRSHERGISGDFGGVRAVLGVNFILF